MNRRTDACPNGCTDGEAPIVVVPLSWTWTGDTARGAYACPLGDRPADRLRTAHRVRTATVRPRHPRPVDRDPTPPDQRAGDRVNVPDTVARELLAKAAAITPPEDTP